MIRDKTPDTGRVALKEKGYCNRHPPGILEEALEGLSGSDQGRKGERRTQVEMNIPARLGEDPVTGIPDVSYHGGKPAPPIPRQLIGGLR